MGDDSYWRVQALNKIILYLFFFIALPAHSDGKSSKFIGNPLYEKAAEFCSSAGKTKISLDKERVGKLQGFEEKDLLDFLYYKRTVNMRECYVSQIQEAVPDKKISREDWEFVNYMIDMNQVFQRIRIKHKVYFEINEILQVEQPFHMFYIYDQVFKD